jgi:serine/threonine protein kinase
MSQSDAFLAALCDDEDGAEPSHPRLRQRLLGEGIRVNDRYLLKKKLARGGMASVWEAEDTSLGRLVAIKFMSSELVSDPEYRERFAQEARAAARIRSPFVVDIHDHGEMRGVPYIVMERLVGEDLHERLLRSARLPVALVTQIAVEAARALRAAHANGVIHRDLKPQNLFLARQDGVETIKLLDFGVAKDIGSEGKMTATGVMLGSPFYMSPEQIKCERELDGRTDLWSLSAILYRALTGVRPFDGDLAEVMRKILREPPPPPSTLNSDLGDAFDAFFERAFAPAHSDRFATADELASAFEAAARCCDSTSSRATPVSACAAIEIAAPTRVLDALQPDMPTSPVPAHVLEQLSHDYDPEERPSGLRFGAKKARGVNRFFFPKVRASSEAARESTALIDVARRRLALGKTSDAELELVTSTRGTSWLQILAGVILLATVIALTFRALFDR